MDSDHLVNMMRGQKTFVSAARQAKADLDPDCGQGNRLTWGPMKSRCRQPHLYYSVCSDNCGFTLLAICALQETMTAYLQARNARASSYASIDHDDNHCTCNSVEIPALLSRK